MGLIDIKRGIMQGTADSPRCNAGGGGVHWMHIVALKAYHGRTAEGEGEQMTKAEFTEAFESGVLMVDAGEFSTYTGMVLGYKINTVNGGFTIKTADADIGVAFAEE